MKNNIKKFSFQGVDGAYSQLAGKNIYPDAESVPCNTFEEMFDVVKNNQVDCAIVPIENSRAGRVADTQRLIPESNLKIIGEYFIKDDEDTDTEMDKHTDIPISMIQHVLDN